MPMTKEEIEQKRAEAMAAGGSTPAAPAVPAAGGRPQYENRSRLGLATPAIRPGMKARLLLGGPAGAGKTYTSLLIAMTLREHTDIPSVVMIDTEKDSGRTYADEFLLADGSPAYKHISWAAPYNAVDLAMTLRDASGKYDVVIIDSHSHFWRGAGGILDVAGGRWTGWSEARPMHVDMIDAILSCDCHVILCARMTMEHEQTRNPATGKLEVVKLGMKVQQDADLEYEVNVALEMDMNHTLRITKSRTRAVPVGSEFIAGHAEEFGGRYREWLKGGEPAASAEQVDNLVAALNRIEDPANRMRAKQQFQETFGRPEMLLVSRLREAAEWVANAVLGNEPAADRAPDAVPPVPESAESAPAAPQAAAAPPNAPVAHVAEPGDEEAPVDRTAGPQVFNGDPGHCSDCGAPIWFSIEAVRGGSGAWLHADGDEEGACPNDGVITPAGPGIDVDALYAALHPALDAEIAVRAEVDALTQTALVKAAIAEGVAATGHPARLKEALIERRLAVLAGSPAG